MSPALLALLVQFALPLMGELIALAEQHAAAGDHPKTAEVLGVVGSLGQLVAGAPLPAQLASALQAHAAPATAAAIDAAPTSWKPPGRA